MPVPVAVLLAFVPLAVTAAPFADPSPAPPRKEPAIVSIDGFEGGPSVWTFVGGEEFPGAKGSVSLVDALRHEGSRSLRLDADFRNGGAYIGTWRPLESADLPKFGRVRFWVRSTNVGRIGIRIVDESGQCHQSATDLPKGSAEAFQPVDLKLSSLVGGEHWGGLDDGKWHGKPKGLGINIGKDALTDSAKGTGSIWIDDVAVVELSAGDRLPILSACEITPKTCRPGFGTRLRFVWKAEPLTSDCSVFVHFLNEKGEMVFQSDHAPPKPTSEWSGHLEYGHTVAVPTDAKPGVYTVVAGLWNGSPPERGGGRKGFEAGPGLTMLPDFAARLGTLTIDEKAPLPSLPLPTLNLDGYKLTFDEDFNQPLSATPWGPSTKTRWITHTPYGGDFGDARFGDPEPAEGSPFRVENGFLTIEARKTGDRWTSGLLSSVDPEGNGFSQRFGYFEMLAKFPKGLGTWPAFWLMGVPQLKEPKDRKTLTQIEIDVVEEYGVGPNALHATVHLWGPGTFHEAEGDTAIAVGMSDDFHRYGALVEDDFITIYFDGSEVRKFKTPKEAKVPLYLMVDLALGGGWPIDKTPNPSRMVVDSIRVYAKK